MRHSYKSIGRFFPLKWCIQIFTFLHSFHKLEKYDDKIFHISLIILTYFQTQLCPKWYVSKYSKIFIDRFIDIEESNNIFIRYVDSSKIIPRLRKHIEHLQKVSNSNSSGCNLSGVFDAQERASFSVDCRHHNIRQKVTAVVTVNQQHNLHRIYTLGLSYCRPKGGLTMWRAITLLSTSGQRN